MGGGELKKNIVRNVKRIISLGTALALTIGAMPVRAWAESGGDEYIDAHSVLEISDCVDLDTEYNEKNSVTLTWPVPGHYTLSRTYNQHNQQAIDIADGSIAGATVVAAYGGTVYKTYKCSHLNCFGCCEDNCGGVDCDGFGTGVIIKGYDGRYYQYAHMIPGSIPSDVYKGATIAQGQAVGKVGQSGAATGYHLHFEINTTGPWSGHVNPSNESYHSHNYYVEAALAPDCVDSGWTRYKCSCGESYTETTDPYGHDYVTSYIAPTMNTAGKVMHTCTRCQDSYCSGPIAYPELGDDGWYYCEMLPEAVTADSYYIEYKNNYEAVQTYSPGSDWTNSGVYSSEWVNSGNTYKSWYELSTSDSRVLVDSYYYHYCSATTGTVVNYEMTSEYVHHDSVPLHLATIVRTGLDGDIIYYILNWNSDGSRIYCNSSSTCDGSYGTHGDRAYAWYKMHVYQDRVQVVNYLFTKSTDWGSAIDSSASSVSYRFKAKSVSLSDCTVSAISNQTYTGSAIKPSVTVKNGSTTLKNGTDYTVSYSNNINVGTAIVNITGKGIYTGTRTVTFKIVDSKASAFVERLYTNLLGRSSDVNGKANHVNSLKNGSTAADIGAKFVLSTELKNKALTNREFVKRMYQTFLDRTPSSAEITRWATTLDNGCSYAYILKSFVASAEFKKLAASYGITAGTYTVTEYRDYNEKLTAYVSRMYTKALKRSYDVTGLNNHTGRYINGTKTAAQIAQSFFFSTELKNKNLSDEEFVTRLYQALFDRNPDAAGKANWLKRIKNGYTREQVFNGFANSAEFKKLVASFGL